MAFKKSVTTRREILKTAIRLFFENGYSNVSPNLIAKTLGMSTGNLTYYFPTKEHLLSLLVDDLCKFQWQLIEEVAQDGISSVMAVCLELMTMAAACENNPVAKDFFISTYQSSVTLKIIRKNDTERSKQVYKAYCEEWSDEEFAEAEILVSGIEYATLMSLGEGVPLETRISGALDKILYIYGVPGEIRKAKIEKALSYDYRSLGDRLFKEFVEFVNVSNLGVDKE